MKTATIRIEDSPAMRVAVFRATSASPEEDAHRLLREWAEPHGILDDSEAHPVFGFSDPCPDPGQEIYCHETWIGLDEEAAVDEGVEIKHVPAGRFAVLICEVLGNLASIGEGWKTLGSWVHSSDHECRGGPGLERSADPRACLDDLVLELYCPIS